MESATFLHQYTGDNLFVVVLAVEIYMVLLHLAGLIEILPYDRHYRESFVRLNFVVEMYSLHTCYWHFWSPRGYTTMLVHYIIHLISAFNNCFILLADFSKPFTGIGRYFTLAFLFWDTPHHIYTLYYLLTILSWPQILVGVSMFVTFVLTFPIGKMYHKKTDQKTD